MAQRDDSLVREPALGSAGDWRPPGGLASSTATEVEPAPPPSPSNLPELARRLYQGGPLLLRKFQHWRPLICPFETLTSHVPHDARVLDIGCGCGLFLALLLGSRRGISGTGLDLSPKALGLARGMAEQARLLGLSGSVRFLRQDIMRSWPAGLFDVACLIDVAHHLPRAALAGVVRQAAQRLRSGGLFLYKDLDSRYTWRAAANQMHDLAVSRQWVRYVPVGEVEQLARSCGLHVVHAEDVNRLWYSHQLRVFRKG